MNEKYYQGRRLSDSSDGKDTLSDNFLMYSYKVVACTRKYPHDWAQCPCGHKGERAARRDPKLGYVAVACSYAKQRLPCPKGDNCPHAHNLFEYWLHPQRYRTELCQYGSNCERPVCFFAHNLGEIRQLDPTLPPPETCWSAGAAVAKPRSMQPAGSSSSRNTSPSQQQQQSVRMAPTNGNFQQQQQAAAVGASMQFVQQLQLQPQQQVYVQMPGGSVMLVAPSNGITGSQAIVMQQQQQQTPEQFVVMNTNQGLVTMQQQQQLVPVNVLTVPQEVIAASSTRTLNTSNMLPGCTAVPMSQAVWRQPQLQQLDTVQYGSSCFVSGAPAAATAVDAMSDCSSWSTASIADLPCGPLPLSSPAALSAGAGAAPAATSQGLALPIHVAAAAVSAQASGSHPNSPAATQIAATAGVYDYQAWTNSPGMALAPVAMQNSGNNASFNNLGLSIGQQYDIVVPNMGIGQPAIVQPLGASAGGGSGLLAAGQVGARGAAGSHAATAMMSAAFQGLQLQQERW